MFYDKIKVYWARLDREYGLAIQRVRNARAALVDENQTVDRANEALQKALHEKQHRFIISDLQSACENAQSLRDRTRASIDADKGRAAVLYDARDTASFYLEKLEARAREEEAYQRAVYQDWLARGGRRWR